MIQNVFSTGAFNNYLIGGNLCNAFALGSLGSTDDFFLVGAEPEGESSFPLLTGNFLDSEGNLLFRLVRNVLVVNPGHCSKILGNHIGYEIHDGSDNRILKVETRYETLPETGEECFVTTISANFYDRTGSLVFEARSGSADERIESSVKSVFGFTGGFDFVQDLDTDEQEMAKLMLRSGGAIHRLRSGPIENEEITLDGTALVNAQVTGCTVNVSRGDFKLIGNTITNCRFNFSGEAENIRQLLMSLTDGNTNDGI